MGLHSASVTVAAEPHVAVDMARQAVEQVTSGYRARAVVRDQSAFGLHYQVFVPMGGHRGRWGNHGRVAATPVGPGQVRVEVEERPSRAIHFFHGLILLSLLWGVLMLGSRYGAPTIPFLVAAVLAALTLSFHGLVKAKNRKVAALVGQWAAPAPSPAQWSA